MLSKNREWCHDLKIAYGVKGMHMWWAQLSHGLNNSTISLQAATCLLLITFANSLDLDQDQQDVGPDLDPNR